MDPIKLAKFREENPEKKFPPCRSLTESEMEVFRQCLSQRLGCSSSDALVLYRELEKRSGYVDGIDADDKSFSLSATVSNFAITPQDKVYLHWYRENKVDEMAYGDVSAIFHNVWYAGPDDLSICDSSFGWILTIFHDGVVAFRAW